MRSIIKMLSCYFFFFSSRRRHTRCSRDWSSDVCSSDLVLVEDVVDRKRLVAHGRVGDASVTDLDGGEGFAERLPEIPEPVVAREEAVREAARAAVEVQRERGEMVCGRVAGGLGRQTGRGRSA